jgi:hypothetical protein
VRDLEESLPMTPNVLIGIEKVAKSPITLSILKLKAYTRLILIELSHHNESITILR